MLSPIPSLSHLRSRVDQAEALRDDVAKRHREVLVEVKRLENQEALMDLVSELYRRLIDKEVTAGVKAVEKLQSEALQTVFTDQDLSVEAEVGVLRGKVSVDLATVHKRDDGSVIRGSCIEGFGGSVTTVQSMLLRLTVILRRNLLPLMLLDEALPAFDADYIVNVGRFMEALCKRLGMDILMVTHNPALVDSVRNSYRIVRRTHGATFERCR